MEDLEMILLQLLFKCINLNNKWQSNNKMKKIIALLIIKIIIN